VCQYFIRPITQLIGKLLCLAASLIFAIAIVYSVNDFQAILNANGQFPLATFYAQATGSKGGTFALLLVMLPAMIIGGLGTFVMASLLIL
jgi:choline transport protein